MKPIIIVLVSILLSSCSPSPMAITASQACDCIDEKPFKTKKKCVDESIIKNKEILENFYNQGPVLDKEGKVNHFYSQLIHMTMLQNKCQDK